MVSLFKYVGWLKFKEQWLKCSPNNNCQVYITGRKDQLKSICEVQLKIFEMNRKRRRGRGGGGERERGILPNMGRFKTSLTFCQTAPHTFGKSQSDPQICSLAFSYTVETTELLLTAGRAREGSRVVPWYPFSL